MIEQLTSPVEKNLNPGAVTMTHRAWGHTCQPWAYPSIVSYSVLGIMDAGRFVPVAGTEDTLQMPAERVENCLDTSTGTVLGSKVVEQHKAHRVQEANEAAERARLAAEAEARATAERQAAEAEAASLGA